MPSGRDRELNDNLLKLRAVLMLIAASRGQKAVTVAGLSMSLQNTGLKASVRSIYHWRRNYLRLGFAGIARQRRIDRGMPRGFGKDVMAQVVDAAVRVRWYGDIRREYLAFEREASYETFRTWVRRIQARLRVVEMPRRGDGIGFLI
jgi:hypothetical protein